VPELPDIVVYIEALDKRILGEKLNAIRINTPFLVRTAIPPIATLEGKEVVRLRRVGKRICIGFEGDLWLVIHLMIAGRLHWYNPGGKVPKTKPLAILNFDSGTLTMTEAGSKRRASLHVIAGEPGLRDLDRGGLEISELSLEEFAAALQSSNHTLKRALTDPRIFSGIGNAYSDEILFAAQLSPIALTKRLTDEEIERLFKAIGTTLDDWVKRLREDARDRFPEKVTAFRPDMAVHGRYKEACPRCGSKVQRIRYASNETNYCPQCQTGGRLLADRALSRLLREDWPKSAEDLE
jgi:formamidopyrimidine-DNA glycosylase